MPPDFVEVTRDQFDEAMRTQNWLRDGYSGAILYRRYQDRHLLGIHRDEDGTFWLEPRLAGEVS